MYTIRADINKNRLYVTLSGFFTLKEMKEASDKTIVEARKLRPGYDVISDISQFKPVGPDTYKEVERAQAYFISSGVRHGVRVVGENPLTGIQFTRIGKGVGYAADTVATLAEAEKVLDSLDKKEE